MLAVPGYFDGVAVRPLEKMDARPNQKVIITVIDEFLEPNAGQKQITGLRGALAKYADPTLSEKERDAWERAAVEKHGDL